MKGAGMDKKHEALIKRILFVVVNLASFPCVYFMQLSKGLDPSWVFALNYIQTGDARFGKDHFFTYGPLGFLGRCQPLGNNLLFGVLFWLLVAAVQVYLYKRTFDQAEQLTQVVISSGLMVLAFPIGEADLYLCFLALLSLFLVYRQEDFYSKWIAVFLSGIIFLFKFSGTVLLIATLMLFLLRALAEKKPFQTTWIFLCCMAGGSIFYLCYHPSVRSLLRYVKAALEISLGYNQSMSVDVYEAYYVWVILIAACYVCLLLYGVFMRKKHWDTFLLLSAACFFWYKEGFVRNDGHHMTAVCGLLLVCSVLFFYVDFQEWQKGTGGGYFEKSQFLLFVCAHKRSRYGKWKNAVGRFAVPGGRHLSAPQGNR